MQARLLSRNGHGYLAPRAVVDRLEREFAYVEASREAGQRHVLGLIAQLHELLRAGKRPADRNYLERLDAAQSEALYVCFGDSLASDTHVLDTSVIPGDPLVFEFATSEHREATRALLQRCAKALGYDVVEISEPAT